LLSINASAAAPFICSDLPPTEAVFWTEAMGRHSAATFAGNLTFAAWKYVDVTYVHTSLDQIIPLQVQKSMVQKIDEDLKKQGKSVRVFERAVGHMAPLIHPDWIANIIRRVNGEDV
jgi:homoserine acetyltransferase